MVWNYGSTFTWTTNLLSAHTLNIVLCGIITFYCGVSEVPAGSRNGPCWSLVQPGCPPSSTVLSGPDTVPEDNICYWLVTIQILLQTQYQCSFFLWITCFIPKLQMCWRCERITDSSLSIRSYWLHTLSISWTKKHYHYPVHVYKTPLMSTVSFSLASNTPVTHHTFWPWLWPVLPVAKLSGPVLLPGP